jgi:GST-like protein
VKIKYAIDRYSMEVKRQLDVLDRQLADNQFIAGDEYTIADMAIWPWYGNGILKGASYNDPRTFLQTHEYKNLTRWTKEIGERPAVKRGEWSTAPAGRLKNNCTSAMTPAISRPKRRTRSARAGNPS